MFDIVHLWSSLDIGSNINDPRILAISYGTGGFMRCHLFFAALLIVACNEPTPSPSAPDETGSLTQPIETRSATLVERCKTDEECGPNALCHTWRGLHAKTVRYCRAAPQFENGQMKLTPARAAELRGSRASRGVQR